MRAACPDPSHGSGGHGGVPDPVGSFASSGGQRKCRVALQPRVDHPLHVMPGLTRYPERNAEWLFWGVAHCHLTLRQKTTLSPSTKPPRAPYPFHRPRTACGFIGSSFIGFIDHRGRENHDPKTVAAVAVIWIVVVARGATTVVRVVVERTAAQNALLRACPRNKHSTRLCDCLFNVPL